MKYPSFMRICKKTYIRFMQVCRRNVATSEKCSESNSKGIQHGGFSCAIRSNEHGVVFRKICIHVFKTPKVL